MSNMKQTRMTKQRKVILEELSKVCSHPTADEIYSMVREKLPNISLGTVYRNLELLVEFKQILKLETAGSTRRYDANTSHHYHVRCLECGSVDDIMLDDFMVNIPSDSLTSGYKLINVNVSYEGICPKCRQSSIVNVLEKDIIIYEKNSA